MANSSKKSVHQPHVRDGLCRHIRSKGMLVDIGEKPPNDASQRQMLAADRHAMAVDSTVWWCDETSKTVGPDDRPCHKGRCVQGRACFQGEDDAPVA